MRLGRNVLLSAPLLAVVLLVVTTVAAANTLAAPGKATAQPPVSATPAR